MLSQQNIVITLGNYGSIIAVHNRKRVITRIFLKKEDFNSNNHKRIAEIFSKYKKFSVYILIDTLDQSYKKKSLPFVNRWDLKKLITRSLKSEGGADVLKNFTLINNAKEINKLKKSDRSWDVLFITSPVSQDIKNWANFLIDMPNYFFGIYMLPVESYSLFDKLKPIIYPKDNKNIIPHRLNCIIMHNKVSGTRQVVFSNDTIVFTRVVNYDFRDSNFPEKIDSDIYATYEYLKRIYVDLQMDDINVIAVFSDPIINIIKKYNSQEVKYRYYNPYELSIKLGYKDILNKNSSHCDLLISRIFSLGKKKMIFNTPKLKFINKFYKIVQYTYFTNLLAISAVLILILFSLAKINISNGKVKSAETLKKETRYSLDSLRSQTLKSAKLTKKDETVSFERIIDIGKIDEFFSRFGSDYFNFYKKLSFFNKININVSEFKYQLNKYDITKSELTSYDYRIIGEIFNQSGDIEDLFKEFDLLLSETNKTYSDNHNIEFSELPKDIDFSKKYYSFPINFTVKSK
tara:strand:- start:12757 stop:14310 length:1554 start_codon:yes stop_codon:yes gene_type:complete